MSRNKLIINQISTPPSQCRNIRERPAPFADGTKRKEFTVSTIFNELTQEFIAKIYCDLGKNILTIGFASYFFEKLPLPFRFGFVILGVGLILLSIHLISKKGGK